MHNDPKWSHLKWIWAVSTSSCVLALTIRCAHFDLYMPYTTDGWKPPKSSQRLWHTVNCGVFAANTETQRFSDGKTGSAFSYCCFSLAKYKLGSVQLCTSRVCSPVVPATIIEGLRTPVQGHSWKFRAYVVYVRPHLKWKHLLQLLSGVSEED